MGCGQSKIHLYPRKSKSKANGKKGGHADSDADTDEEEGHIEDAEKSQSRERDKNDDNEDQSNKDAQDSDEDVSVSLLRAKNLSLLQSQEISTSQQNFFRMLDKKIEEGPDYDSCSETEIALEEARLNALVQHWESASLTASICSSASRSLQTTPIRQAPTKQMGTPRNVLQPTVAMPVPMPIPMTVQQPVIATDFITLGTPPTVAQLSAATVGAGGAVKHTQGSQQIVISHMNTKMLHQLTVLPQMPISITPETSATTANSSNALAIMQASNQGQQAHYSQQMMASSSSQQMGNIKVNVSPKRLMDSRLFINSSPLAQQMHTVSAPLSNAYMSGQSATIGVVSGTNTYANGGTNSGLSSQPAIPIQLAYFGQPTQQQQIQHQVQHQQYQQHSQHPQHQTSSASIAMATMTMTAAQNDQQTPQSQSQPFYGDQIQMHSMQPPTEYKFPPAISVQRLAPQVQRQLRETQELIKDSCPQLFAAGYGGSPGPPIRNQAKNPNRRPTLETQFSQESS